MRVLVVEETGSELLEYVPVIGARVYANSVSGNGAFASVSDNNGSAAFEYLPEGTYMMMVDKISFNMIDTFVIAHVDTEGFEITIPLKRTLSVREEISFTPLELSLLTVSPNPFNSKALQSFTLGESYSVRLSLTDITGKTVWEKELGTLGAGNHSVILDVSDLKTGVYLSNLYLNNEVKASTKTVLIK
jgi:hypothetical protein